MWIVIVFGFLQIYFIEASLPNYIPVCHRADPNINRCIINSVEVLRSKLREGIPELAVPAIEPLIVPHKISIPLGDNRYPKTNLTNLRIYGISNYRVLELKVKPTRNYFRFKVKCPTLSMDGTYEINTKFLFLELKGTGPIRVNVTDFYSECVLQGQRVTRKMKEYLKFNQMICSPRFGDVHVTLEDLFKNSPTLTKTTNDVINENVRLIFEDIRIPLLDTITQSFTATANRITERFTYDELFP